MERFLKTIQRHVAGPFTSSGRARFLKDYRVESWAKEQKEASCGIWEQIFKTDDWVQAVVSQGLWPVLVGHQLGATRKHSRHDVYMALALVRLEKGITSGETCSKSLAMSLRSEISMKTLEVDVSTFTLNVSAIMEEGAEIEVPDSSLVFGARKKGSTCLVYFPDDPWGSAVVTIPVDTKAKTVVVRLNENNEWGLRLPNTRLQEIRGKMGCSITELSQKAGLH